MSKVIVKKLTPVVIVERIEPLLEFYVGGLGFTQAGAVPHGEGLGFVMLVAGGVELMFQTAASVRDDTGNAGAKAGPVCLYMDVEDLDEAVRAVAGSPVVVARRTTSYGMEEVFVRDPAGNVVGLAMAKT